MEKVNTIFVIVNMREFKIMGSGSQAVTVQLDSVYLGRRW